jgi:hypothetical protein
MFSIKYFKKGITTLNALFATVHASFRYAAGTFIYYKTREYEAIVIKEMAMI